MARSDRLPRVPGGLYVLTPARLCGDPLLRAVEAALDGGARMVQYRGKAGTTLAEALALRRLCQMRAVPFLVNDDPALARAAGADGVHVGRDDTGCAAARAMLGPSAIIGVSCYDRFDLAADAITAGADYVAFGSFFPSDTKPHAVRPSSDLLRQARRSFAVPIVAIGGVTPDNGRSLLAAGADLLAVIAGVFDAPDPRAAAGRYARLFDAPTQPQDGPA